MLKSVIDNVIPFQKYNSGAVSTIFQCQMFWICSGITVPLVENKAWCVTCFWTCSVDWSWLIFLSNQNLADSALLYFLELQATIIATHQRPVFALSLQHPILSFCISVLFVFQSHFPPEYNFIFLLDCIHRENSWDKTQSNLTLFLNIINSLLVNYLLS